MANNASTKLRCREGDLALIIKEESGCESNIGRIVTVSGPVIDTAYRGPTWLIQPVTPEPWSVHVYEDGSVWSSPITYDDRIEHPDDWLLPLRPKDELDWLVESVIGQKTIMLEKDKAVDLTTFLRAVDCENVTDLGFPFEMDAEKWAEIRTAWLRMTEGGMNLTRPFSRQGLRDLVDAYQPFPAARDLARKAMDAHRKTSPRETPEGTD